MAIPIRPEDLPAGSPTNTAAVPFDSGTQVQKATPLGIVDAAIPLASQAEAEAGTDNVKRVTSLRVAQAIDARGYDASIAARPTSAALASTTPGQGASLIVAESGDTLQEVVDGKLPFSQTPEAPYISATVGDRLSKTVYITDAPYLSAAGGADMTTPIRDAIAKGASEIVIPSNAVGSLYDISDTIELPSQVKIRGQNAWPSIIRCTALDQPIFYGDGVDHVTLSNLSLQYSGTPLEGADAIWADNCQFWNLDYVWSNIAWNCFRADGGGGNHKLIGFRGFEYRNAGILVADYTGDVEVTNFRLSAGTSPGAAGGICLLGGVEAFTASQGDVTLGAYGINTAGVGGSSARFASPWYNRFSKIFFDSPLNSPAYLRNLSRSDFESCGFGSAGHDPVVGFGSAANKPGIDMDACSHVRFNGGDVYANGGYGALLYNTNKFVHFGGGMTFNRNMFSRSSDGPAIQVLAGTTDFRIQGVNFQRDADTTTYRQAGSVDVGAGASDRYIIADNLLGGCTAPTDGGSGVNKRVGNNY